MKEKADILYGIKVRVYEGEHGTCTCPSSAECGAIRTLLEVLHLSIMLVDTYRKHKEAKDKTPFGWI